MCGGLGGGPGVKLIERVCSVVVTSPENGLGREWNKYKLKWELLSDLNVLLDLFYIQLESSRLMMSLTDSSLQVTILFKIRCSAEIHERIKK